jgi:hypothetical protein
LSISLSLVAAAQATLSAAAAAQAVTEPMFLAKHLVEAHPPKQ